MRCAALPASPPPPVVVACCCSCPRIAASRPAAAAAAAAAAGSSRRGWSTTSSSSSGSGSRAYRQHQQHVRPLASSRRAALLSGGSAAAAAGLAVAAAAVAAAAAAASGGGGGGGGQLTSPQALVRRGMDRFRAGDVAGSLEDYDEALARQPQLRPYLWQRGLSLYYLGEYAEGARQFRDDVAVNPNDTEEALWAFLCEARLEGADAAAARMLKVGRDSRAVCRAAYEQCSLGSRGDPAAILAAAGPDLAAGGHGAFYAWLYAALLHEARGGGEGEGNAAEAAAAARDAMLRAVATPYARGSGDFMADLARVHARLRGWDGEEGAAAGGSGAAAATAAAAEGKA